MEVKQFDPMHYIDNLEVARAYIVELDTLNARFHGALNQIASRETKTLHDAQAIAFGALTEFI